MSVKTNRKGKKHETSNLQLQLSWELASLVIRIALISGGVVQEEEMFDSRQSGFQDKFDLGMKPCSKYWLSSCDDFLTSPCKPPTFCFILFFRIWQQQHSRLSVSIKHLILSGSKGIQGPQGFLGLPGTQGPMGISGVKGEEGTMGPPGPSGECGDMGMKGL